MSGLEVSQRPRSFRRRDALAALLMAPLMACGSEGLARPPSGPHQAGLERVIEAEYPPPPAQVEHVGPRPDPTCVWVDGYWEFRGRRWEWLAGGWFVPPRGCYRAPPEMFWTLGEDTSGPGKLFYRLPAWYPAAEGARTTGQCADARPCRNAMRAREGSEQER